jgi:indole-3-glycerol phosphate synthase
MANILDKIFAAKKTELGATQREAPLAEVKNKMGDQRDVIPILDALRASGEGSKIIAEIKRRTPFKGDLVEQFDPLAIARTYADSGAAAISILTESQFFGGDLKYVEQARKAVSIPLLRKDFIFDEYQVYESRACGADFFLLIATSLDKNQLKDLLELGKEIGLTALVETHDEKDMEKAFHAGAELLGINNRDLTSGTTDLEISKRLLKETRGMNNLLLVCESGIHSRAQIEEFEGLGMHAFLIGESLMKAPNISDKLQEFTGHGKIQPAG